MNKQALVSEIKAKKSFLCVGLDTDLQKIPKHLLQKEDPIFEFNRAIIDSTKDYAVAYKPNIAFYESMGAAGWQSLARTMEYIPKNIFTIADAKRGDIGNTSSLYARAFFDKKSSGMEFDSVTVAPYMGIDSVAPFLEFKGKWVILLALTSNKGSEDFQYHGDKPLFEKVLQVSQNWGDEGQLMYVVGATRAVQLKQVRAIVPDHFLLVPGVGAQGGNLADVAANGMNKECGLLVNSSRGIIYASKGEDFAEKAGEEAKKLQIEMAALMEKYMQL